MGANGSLARTGGKSPVGDAYDNIGKVGKIHVVQLKNPKQNVNLPPKSVVPNCIVAIFCKNGADVQKLAGYGPDCMKQWEVHTEDHYGLNPHYHPWEDGKPVSIQNPDGTTTNLGERLTEEMEKLLNQTRNYGSENNWTK